MNLASINHTEITKTWQLIELSGKHWRVPKIWWKVYLAIRLPPILISNISKSIQVSGNIIYMKHIIKYMYISAYIYILRETVYIRWYLPNLKLPPGSYIKEEHNSPIQFQHPPIPSSKQLRVLRPSATATQLPWHVARCVVLGVHDPNGIRGTDEDPVAQPNGSFPEIQQPKSSDHNMQQIFT